MSLPSLSVKRHVMTYMLSLVLILFGVISYQRVGVDRIPNIDFPMLSVTTVLAGADPEIIDISVTNVIESAVNSVSGIETLRSSSLSGLSLVVIQFDLNRDIDAAFNEVQAKINAALRLLPSDAETPVVRKIEAGATPILWLALSGDRTLQQLNQYARNQVKKRLETVSGVGNVIIAGERERTIRVALSPTNMAAHQVAIDEVVAAFARQHIKLPGGFIDNGLQEWQLKLDLEFHDLATLRQLVIRNDPQLPLTLGEIADIEDGLADYRRHADFNGDDAVGLGIIKVSGANSVAIIDEIKRRLDQEIRPQLPAGMKIDVVVDDGSIINGIVSGLQSHLVEGTLLAGLVVWLFLKNLRATTIIVTAIPVSLMAAITAIYFSGYTFNLMTLLGLLLLIGVVVDDAIVVLENIFHHMEAAQTDEESDHARIAITAADEVMFPVVAASLTLIALFGAVLFMQGIIGRFLESFAVVVVFGVLASLFVSLTLTPMLCARYLRVVKRHGLIYRMLEALFVALENGYRAILRFALQQRLLVVIIAIAIVYSTGWFMQQLGKGFMPEEDEGRFLVSIKTPLGTPMAMTRERLQATEAVLGEIPEVAGLFSTIGAGDLGQVNKGTIYVNLVPRLERQRHQKEIIADARDRLGKLSGVMAFASPVPMIGGDRGEPLQFVLKGPELTKVAALADQLAANLRVHKEIGPLDSDLQLNMPTLKVIPDRAAASELGISMQQLGLALQVLAGGFDIAKYNDDPGDGERYPIRLKAALAALQSEEDLATLYLRNSSGDLIRFSSVADFVATLGPSGIGRHNLQYAATFYATPTIADGDAGQLVLATAAKMLPPGYSVELIGRAKEFEKTVAYVLFAFGSGILLIYMTLASQFNSFIQPLVVMVAQPLAMVGGIMGLWLMGHSLNIYSMIGMVLLVGLVAKNSILLIDLANQLRRDKGMTINAALLQACPRRMRPVLMTSLTIILSLLPAAMGLGAGSDTNAPLAVAVIGGMISSTLLTLIIVPAVYSLVEGGLMRLQQWRHPV
ncbi:MAG: efflux RND transporter permease subunit [Gammaproteobacteria bacterium]|nr:efflux RND transporter permease subunit [Gammaproteobacteria bacterium]